MAQQAPTAPTPMPPAAVVSEGLLSTGPMDCATGGRPTGQHVHVRRPPRPEPMAMAPDPVQAASPGAFPRLCRGVQRVAARRVPLCPLRGHRRPTGWPLAWSSTTTTSSRARPSSTSGARDKLAAVAATLPTTFYPVVIERTPTGHPGLEQSRRSVLLAQLAQGSFPVPAERVVIGPSIAYGMAGFEAVN